MAVALALPGLRARAWLRRKGLVIDQIDGRYYLRPRGHKPGPERTGGPHGQLATRKEPPKAWYNAIQSAVQIRPSDLRCQWYGQFNRGAYTRLNRLLPQSRARAFPPGELKKPLSLIPPRAVVVTATRIPAKERKS